MMHVTKTVVLHILSTITFRKQLESPINTVYPVQENNNNRNSHNNNNKKNDESDTTKADVTSLVFQNVVDVMGYVKREKRIHDNLERFTRIMFTLISSENLLKKYSASDLGRVFGYHRITIKKD